jgi:sugar/nucleoside kinase (ribokinase family)
VAAERAVELARSSRTSVSVDLAAATLVEALGRETARAFVEHLGLDAVLCNEDEDAAIGGAVRGPTWIVKRGARGACVDGEEHPAPSVARAIDATGAGDAFAAGWILGGIERGLEAASRCVEQVGALPGPGATA